jgi:hypothetical protein
MIDILVYNINERKVCSIALEKKFKKRNSSAAATILYLFGSRILSRNLLFHIRTN